MKWYNFSIMVRAQSPQDALEGVKKSIPFIAKEAEFPEPDPEGLTIVMGGQLVPIDEAKTTH
jgi:hypothetical protein